LAFANFRSPAETDACVAALNGFDIQGRKLRVEYKKVLKPEEKERIEREKALRRMKSMQLEKERLAAADNDDWDDFGRFTQQSSLGYNNSPSGTLTAGTGSGRAGGFGAVGMGQVGSSPSMADSSSDASGGLGPPTTAYQAPKVELDMNDPKTLEIYSRVLLFKDDSMRDELSFARSLSASQRRIVHVVAQKLDLDHCSVGQGEDRHVVVTKGRASDPPKVRIVCER
jgi:RNA recognition motif-containing protein